VAVVHVVTGILLVFGEFLRDAQMPAIAQEPERGAGGHSPPGAGRRDGRAEVVTLDDHYTGFNCIPVVLLVGLPTLPDHSKPGERGQHPIQRACTKFRTLAQGRTLDFAYNLCYNRIGIDAIFTHRDPGGLIPGTEHLMVWCEQRELRIDVFESKKGGLSMYTIRAWTYQIGDNFYIEVASCHPEGTGQ